MSTLHRWVDPATAVLLAAFIIKSWVDTASEQV
jgi:hypothetical protein